MLRALKVPFEAAPIHVEYELHVGANQHWKSQEGERMYDI